MGISWPWEDDCPDEMEVTLLEKPRRVFKLIQGPTPNDNILWGAYASWDCVYQAQDGTGDIYTDRHYRVLWIIDF
jgi:hypothetical protein